MTSISNKNSELAVTIQTRAEAPLTDRPVQLAIIDLRVRSSSLDTTVERIAASPADLDQYRALCISKSDRSAKHPRIVNELWPYPSMVARFWLHADRCNAVLAIVPDRTMALLSLVPILIASKFYHVRTIVRVGGGARAGKSPWYRLCMRWILKTVDQVVTCSDREAMILTRLGIDTAVISPILPDRPHRTAQPIQPHLVHLMTTWSESEITHILGALGIVKQKYPRAALSIAAPRKLHGRVRDLARIESKSAEHAITLATEEHLDELLAAGDLCICAFADSDFPIDLRLAWQRGVPVLAPEFGNAAALIRDHENGILFSALNRSSLADRIIEIVESSALADRMSNAGLAEAERYAWEAVWPQWRRILGVPDPV